MLNTPSPYLIPDFAAYPTTADIGRAVAFKEFAAWLLEQAQSYDFTLDQVAEVQRAAREFINLLVCRTQYATAAIVCQRLGLPGPSWVAHWPERNARLHAMLAKARARIEQHLAYCPTTLVDCWP